MSLTTTYLDLINDVLIRLREPQVASVSQNTYSSLIGKLINDAKREIEDSWNWDVLRSTVSFTTQQGTFNYSLGEAGNKFRVIAAHNDTDDIFLQYRPTRYFVQQLLLTQSPQQGAPIYFNPNGVDSNRDGQIDLLPIPDTEYIIRFDLVIPEDELTTDTSTTALQKNIITSLAWAKAIEERGEDGGINVSSQYAVAKQELSYAIAIEAARRPDEETVWYPS